MSLTLLTVTVTAISARATPRSAAGQTISIPANQTSRAQQGIHPGQLSGTSTRRSIPRAATIDNTDRVAQIVVC